MPFRNSLDHRESDARSGIVLPAVKPLKDFENLFGVSGLNADAIVRNLEHHLPAGALRSNPDMRGALIAAVGESVVHQIVEYMADELSKNQARIRFMAQFDAMYARDWPVTRRRATSTTSTPYR